MGLLSGSVSTFSDVESECMVAAAALTKCLWGFSVIGDQLEKCFHALGGGVAAELQYIGLGRTLGPPDRQTWGFGVCF